MSSKRIVATDKAPKAIGPYSQAVACGGWVFVSGQIPIDPATGSLVTGDIKAETRRSLDNLKAIVLAAGSDLSRVVKCTVFLADLADFAAMNEVYGQYFREAPPARATVEVKRLPRDVRVEIDAVAWAGEGSRS